MKHRHLIACTDDLVRAGHLASRAGFSPNETYLDVILVSGDALVDHPSFGTAMIARFLESLGCTVGVIPQPDWTSPDSVRILGRPGLFFGVSSGNLDSMLHHYTAAKKKRSDDPYSPDGKAGCRPNRAVIVYSGLIRAAYGQVPLIIGGMEASLRRLAHYDYWEDRVRRSILLDARADILVYGNAEKALEKIVRIAREGVALRNATPVQGTVVVRTDVPPGDFLALPSCEDVSRSPAVFGEFTRLFSMELAKPGPRTMVQKHQERYIWHLPPADFLSTPELDALYAMPFTRKVHPVHGGRRVPALETVQHSITTHRGCYGGCAFCALAVHQGLVIRSRSEKSILEEVRNMVSAPGFTGTITDVGGPSANMYGTFCGKAPDGRGCSRMSCLHPDICPHLKASAVPSLRLWERIQSIPGVRHLFVASGIRFDLALRSVDYIRKLVQEHTGGHLKVAPEHVSDGVLALMRKPPVRVFLRFLELFRKFRSDKSFLIPYMMSSHPGCTMADMKKAREFLIQNGIPVEQVQDFIPLPGTWAAAMYHAGMDPDSGKPVFVEKSAAGKLRQRHALDMDLQKGRGLSRRSAKNPGNSRKS